ncbi:DNA modification methylase [Mesorhizobium jarvisii]
MSVKIVIGDCRQKLSELADCSVNCCVTSPPYFGLRDYGVDGQIGMEESPDAFVVEMVSVFRAVRRVLRDDGTLWLNLGDSYANDGKWGGHTGGKHVSALHCSPIGRNKRYTGLKPKDLIGIPWRVAFALQEDGWYLRSDIIWHKPNPMPESVTDRPTSAHEHIFLFSKADRYHYDADAIREAESVPDWDDGSRIFGGVNKHGANAAHGDRTTGRRAGVRKRGLPPRHAQYVESSDQSGLDQVPRGGGRNARNVWTIATRPYAEAHFATFPPNLAERCIKAGCPGGGTVLDPFGGAGTTGLVADQLQRNAILIELNPAYAEMARHRISDDAGMFGEVAA